MIAVESWLHFVRARRTDMDPSRTIDIGSIKAADKTSQDSRLGSFRKRFVDRDRYDTPTHPRQRAWYFGATGREAGKERVRSSQRGARRRQSSVNLTGSHHGGTGGPVSRSLLTCGDRVGMPARGAADSDAFERRVARE